ncbi:MAG TPA: hypothetical protein VGQ81_04705, partial [Acidobacteriota bacterium]|nr:hypothetical protein [Acidobacteriota bacterium]
KRIFFELKEDISSLFMGLELADRKPRAVACDGIPKVLDLDEKLSIFRREVYQELTELKQSHRQKAESIEPFQLPLTLHEVNVVGAAVLWQ